MWRRFGCDYNIIQVSPGPLHGRLRVINQDGILLVSMQADQALFLEGDRNPGWLPFTIEHTGNYSDHRHFGEPLAPNTLAGFNTNLKESLVRTSAGAVISALYLSIGVALRLGLSLALPLKSLIEWM